MNDQRFDFYNQYLYSILIQFVFQYDDLSSRLMIKFQF